MTTKITLDKAGRFVIPKTLRQELQLAPGDTLLLESHKKEHGVWVYQGEPTHPSIPDLIDREREKRLRQLMAP